MLALIPLFPFLGFLVNAVYGRRLPRSFSGGLASAAMMASFLVSVVGVWRLAGMEPEVRVVEQTLYTWIASGDFVLDLTLRLDPLSAVMLLVVTGIGTLIHVYSTAYMHEERESEFARYFSYLNLFAAFMLVLVLGSNFLVMFVGWEGVGLCSYLLIGFWFTKRNRNRRGQEGVCREPHRRLCLPSRDAAPLRAVRHPRLSGAGIDGDGVAAGNGHLWCAVDCDAAALHRRHGQVCADSAVCVVAGCDGRSHAGLGADSRGDDGHGRCVHDRPQRGALQPRARDDVHRCSRWRADSPDGRDDRTRAERHQAGTGVLHRVAARLHVPGDGRGRVWRRHLPSLHARLLQSAALPSERAP